MIIRSIPEQDKLHLRTIFLSDTHLGTKGCQAERLLSFLNQHTCNRLYLVGDIVDGWRMKSAGIYWPQSHVDVVRRVLTMTRRGTEVIYVSGNHDEFLREHSPLQIGNLRIVDEAVHETAKGEKLLVVHGDQFDVITRYHHWIAWLGDVGYTVLLELNRFLNRLRSSFGYGYWSLSAWLKHKVKQAVSYIGDYGNALTHHCRRLGFDGVVCGHIHHAEITELDGVIYMNCGDWVESCTALVEDDEGVFRIIDWNQAHGEVTSLYPLEDERLSA